MSVTAEATEVQGEFRVPRNMAATHKGSIHDDATASKLGFRGGTVAGSIHMDQFVPILAQLYSDAWFETGNISLYFTKATTDAEPVRAFARRDGRQARLWMEDEPGDQVCEGTGACGEPDTESELAGRLKGQEKARPDTLRILRNIEIGSMGEPATVRTESKVLDGRLETITERLPEYDGKGRFKGRVLPPSVCVQLCSLVQRQRLNLDGPAVGLYGAIEFQFVEGPFLADTDYINTGRILALSESPKTENLWFESKISDRITGHEIGRMTQYLRFMKGSSPHYK